MKGLIKPWAALGVFVLAGCASAPQREATDANDAARSAESASAVELAAQPEVVAVTRDDSDADPSALPAFYSEDQAIRGEGFFRETCLSCHASSEFRGSTFERQWKGRTVRDLYASIAFSMPDDNPGGLPAQTYTDIIAYVLELNGYPAGASELKPDRTAMRAQALWPDG